MSKNTAIDFTDHWVKGLPLPLTGRGYYRDTQVNSFGICVTPNGAKSFYLRKRIKGRDERIIIGSAAILSVEKARVKAREMLEQISDGFDPVAEKRKKLFNQLTFRRHCVDYIELYSKLHKKTWQQDQRDIDRFFSQWSDRTLSEVSRFEVQKLYYKICDEHGMFQANRSLERLKAIFNKAIEWGWIGENPARKIKTYREKARERFIQPEEMPFILQSLDNEPSATVRDYFWMLFLTGARKTNMLMMRWEEINWQRQTWRIPETKNGDPLILPLMDRAIAILKQRQEQAVSEWVFPSEADNEKHFINTKRAWKRIIQRATIYQWSEDETLKPLIEDCQSLLPKDSFNNYWMRIIREQAAEHKIILPAGLMDTRIHDIRRTFASYQAINGSNLQVIGRSLGHRCTKSTLVYARLSLDPVRSSISQATEAMLASRPLTEIIPR